MSPTHPMGPRHRWRGAVAGIVTLAIGLGAGSPAADLPPAGDNLASALHRHLSNPAFAHASWGVEVARAETGTVLFATNAHRLLKPASNAKLFTGALALDVFGPDHRILTDLVPTGSLGRNGTLKGDLIVVGRGDFSFAARFHGGDGSKSLEPLVDALHTAGVRRIEGALVADDELFGDAPFGTGWTWDDLQYYYGAEVGALSLDDNVVDLVFTPGSSPGDPVGMQCTPSRAGLEFRLDAAKTTAPGSRRDLGVQRDPGSRVVRVTGTLPVGTPAWTDSITVPQPGLHFVTELRSRLESAGIRVRGGVRHAPGAAARARARQGEPRARLLPALSVPSRPMAELVSRMMKPSQNLYAQLLLLQAGTRVPAEPAAGTEPEGAEGRGIRALESFVARAGIPVAEVRLDDGSGLSRSALVTADALVRLLRYMDQGPLREPFIASLPVAGVDGTLRSRFKGTRAEGNLRAKTGSLRYVSTLSGFVTNSEGQRLVFSVLLNAYAPATGAPSGREALDELVRCIIEAPVPREPTP